MRLTRTPRQPAGVQMEACPSGPLRWQPAQGPTFQSHWGGDPPGVAGPRFSHTRIAYTVLQHTADAHWSQTSLPDPAIPAEVKFLQQWRSSSSYRNWRPEGWRGPSHSVMRPGADPMALQAPSGAWVHLDPALVSGWVTALCLRAHTCSHTPLTRRSPTVAEKTK